MPQTVDFVTKERQEHILKECTGLEIYSLTGCHEVYGRPGLEMTAYDGRVGQSWAIVFSTANFKVRIFDKDGANLKSGMDAIRSKMAALEEQGCLRGSGSTDSACALITPAESVQECVKGAIYIQECVFEKLDLKRSVLEEVVEHVTSDVIIASSTGGIFPSQLSEGLQHQNRIVVAHPLNPVHLVPLVEIIQAPWTDQSAVDGTRCILKEAGQEPIVAKKETHGFIICRIQHSITSECFKLIRDDVVSPEDLEKLMPYGLGLRYAFLGALETCYINFNGMKHFASIYGDGVYELQQHLGPPIKFEGEPLDKIQESLEQSIPLDKLEERRKWRDERLAELYKLKHKTSQ